MFETHSPSKILVVTYLLESPAGGGPTSYQDFKSQTNRDGAILVQGKIDRSRQQSRGPFSVPRPPGNLTTWKRWFCR